MKNFIIFILIMILCCCNLFSIGIQEVKDFKVILSSADLIEISYGWWGNDGFDIDVVDKEIKDAEKINTIIDYLTEKRTAITECGYDGTLDFKKGGKSILEEKILFTIECKRFVFVYKGNQICVFVTDKGIEYLQNLYNELLQQMNSKKIE